MAAASHPGQEPRPEFVSQARRDLDSLVMTIELTLISVMAGMLLFMLADFAAPLVRDLRIEYWPYAIGNLLILLWIWALVMGHLVSFIRWPLDLGHNLLYVSEAFLIGMQQHFLTDPVGWFVLTGIGAVALTVTTYYDTVMLRRKAATAQGYKAEMYRLADRRQRALLLSSPITIVYTFGSVALLLLFPDLFIARHAHLILISLFGAYVVLELVLDLRAFALLRGVVLYSIAEELARQEEKRPETLPGAAQDVSRASVPARPGVSDA